MEKKFWFIVLFKMQTFYVNANDGCECSIKSTKSLLLLLFHSTSTIRMQFYNYDYVLIGKTLFILRLVFFSPLYF